MIKKIFVILLLTNLPFILRSQINVDALFNSAIYHVDSQNYAKAIDDAEKVIKADASRYDVMVFISNVHAWDGNYNKALEYIDQARQINSDYKALYGSWLNILLRSGRYKALLEHRFGLEYYFPMKKGLEASLGGRGFYWDSKNVFSGNSNQES